MVFTTLAAGAAAEDVAYSANSQKLDRAWNSFYGGIQGGYSWGHIDADTVWGPGGATEHFTYDADGSLFGIHVGFNRRQGDFLVGIETDIELADINNSGRGTVTAVHAADIGWMGSLRARIGIISDKTLLYLTGGLAYANASVEQRTIASTVPYSGNTELMTGWTLGAGIEQSLAEKITARIEYRYTDLGPSSYVDSVLNMKDTKRFDTHALRVGLSMHF